MKTKNYNFLKNKWSLNSEWAKYYTKENLPQILYAISYPRLKLQQDLKERKSENVPCIIFGLDSSGVTNITELKN